MRTRIILEILFLPPLFGFITRRLIPGLYETGVVILSAMLLLQIATAIYAIFLMWRWCWRSKDKEAKSGLAALGTIALAAWIWFNGLLCFDVATREGAFVCGRELLGEYSCPQGGEVYTYQFSCIAGNINVQYGIRRNWLPFMSDWSEPVDPSVNQWSPASICLAIAEPE